MKTVFAFILLSGFAFSFSLPVFAQSQLSDGQRKTLDYVKKEGNYTVDVIDLNVGGRMRSVVVLGESHVKFGAASKQGKDVIGYFPIRGVEGYTGDDVAYWTSQSDLQANKTIQESNLASDFLLKIVRFNVKRSVIYDSFYSGFYFAPDGGVHYKSKPLGVMIPADSPAVKKDDPSVIRISGWFQKIAQAYAISDGKEDVYVKVLDPKVAAEAQSDRNPAVDIDLEYGSLANYDSDCRAQHKCDYLVDIRNRRMAANVLATLIAIPELRQFVVLIGAGHAKGLVQQIKKTSERL